MVSNYVTL